MARKRQEDPNDPFIKMGGHYVDEDEETSPSPQQTATPQEDPFIAMGGHYVDEPRPAPKPPLIERLAAAAPTQFMLSAGRAAQEPAYQLGDIINSLLSKIPGVQIGPWRW
jgi:hypothetical protein